MFHLKEKVKAIDWTNQFSNAYINLMNLFVNIFNPLHWEKEET